MTSSKSLRQDVMVDSFEANLNAENTETTSSNQKLFYPEDIGFLTEREKIDLRRDVTHRFRGGGTPYLTSLIKKSDAIRKQFVPTYHEGLQFGNETPFEEGRENKGIYGLERIYEDRAVLTPYFDCAAYCRYCFKKTRTLAGDGRVMTSENMDAAVKYIAADSRLDTVLITGGDPLARPDMIENLLKLISPIPHIKKIRIGTRHILFQPMQVTDEVAAMIASYNHTDALNLDRSKSVSVGLSLNHSDELTPEVVSAVQKFAKRGVTVRGQIVLLKGINDNVETMKRLIDRFLLAGIVPYYLFHCMDVVGTYHMRTSVKKGLDILGEIAEFSGVMNPTYVYVTPVGKHRIAPGHEMTYEMIDAKRYIRARSPYRADRFFEFSGKQRLPKLHEVDDDGYIISRYLDGNDEEIVA